MNTLCIWIGLIVAAIGTAVHAEPIPANRISDGPYVFYRDGKVNVINFRQEDDQVKVERKVYREDEKDNVMLNVVPEGHPDWAFQVGLKPQINNEPAVYGPVQKAFFLSDIEGEFLSFRKMLLAGKVIDEQYHWIFGNGSLVIAGDLFDRGKDVVPELWLLYKLEQDGEAQGGKVHVLLGNHDIMNLSGDHRYTDAKYFKNAWLLQMDCTGLFGKDTELGRWLRSKNLIEKLGDLLVLHGGVSPAVNALNMPLTELNYRCRPFYDRAYEGEALGAAKLNMLFDFKTSPFWHRGYFMAPKISTEELDHTLSLYACKQIIVGHTIVKKLNPALYHEGKVLGLDVDEHSGDSQGVLLENGKWQIVNAKGHKQKLTYHPANDRITDQDIL